jgi:UDP:flavonoid glycosyltransferase YjiC (YdhE family)
MKALAHGLPIVVMPLGRDQKDNAAPVEMCGAGVRISARASAAQIAEAVRRVLREPRFRGRARRMATIIARDLQEDRAIVELEALAAGKETEPAASSQLERKSWSLVAGS